MKYYLNQARDRSESHSPPKFARQVPSDLYIRRCAEYRKRNANQYALVLVTEANSRVPQRGYTYRVTRQEGLKIRSRLEEGKTVLVVIQFEGKLKICPVVRINVNVSPDLLEDNSKFVYQILDSEPQFKYDHMKETAYGRGEV